jgi:hypothetical protein
LPQQYGYCNMHSQTDSQNDERIQEMLLECLKYLKEQQIREEENRMIFELECG